MRNNKEIQKRCCSLRPIFPHVDFLRSDLTLRGDALCDEKAADFLSLTQGIELLKATFLGLPVESVWILIVVMGLQY